MGYPDFSIDTVMFTKPLFDLMHQFFCQKRKKEFMLTNRIWGMLRLCETYFSNKVTNRNVMVSSNKVWVALMERNRKNLTRRVAFFSYRFLIEFYTFSFIYKQPKRGSFILKDSNKVVI